MAAELRTETRWLLVCNCPPNLTSAKRDSTLLRIVLDKQDYLNKAQDVLADKDTYKPITGDPTSRHKNKLILTLRTMKVQGRLSDSTYKRLYPTGTVPPKFFGLPKIHKHGTPSGPLCQTGVQ